MDAAILGNALENATADTTILMYMEREQIQAHLADSIPQSFTQTLFHGVGCRSLVKGSWGFSSSTNIKDTPEIVKIAEQMASLTSQQVNFAESEPVSGEWCPEIKKPVTIEDMDILFEFIKEADEAVKDIPAIVSDSVSIFIIHDDKVIMSSEGTHIHQIEPRIICSLTVTAKKSGKIAQGREITGGERGLEFFEKGYLAETAVNLAHRVSRKIDAVLPPSGTLPVLLSGEVVGLLTHEAVGHAAEADAAQGESFLSGRINEMVASPNISIVDDATVPGGFGTYGFDDEGVPAQSTRIIDNGILKSYLHSRETASNFKTHSTGNARAWLFSREPLVRMSNTHLLPESMSFEELLEEVKTGLYLSGDKGGSADRNGQFTFATTDAQKIEKGELTEEYYLGTTIAGDTLEALKTCTAVGDDKTFVLRASICSKGESAFVGGGGPALVTKLHVGGGI
ncbi:MAG: TldD/PmbA family protein [Theionarchaea archaeon]|nr:TldD/PmbA family protein [Theionarchaea archaeon]